MASLENSGLVLDGNVFGLQTYGGVSSYAARLYVELSGLGRQPKLILPHELLYKGFGKDQITTAMDARRERLPARITQYLPAHAGQQSALFLSPYYRRPANPVRRYIVTVHDFTYEHFRNGPALWIHHSVKAAAIRAADAIICISEATRSDLLEYFPSTDPARLHVIHHGVGTETFYPDSVGAPEVMNSTVLFVGRRDSYKRFDLAAETIASLPDLRLGIVGPDLLPDEIALLARLVPGRWTWFGRVDDPTLRKLYSSAYAFIFPSEYEGFGLPVLEAMACGCPTVISTDRALREVGGKAALVAAEPQPEAYAGALTALGSSKQRADLIGYGYEIVNRASWEECAHKTAEVFDAG